MEERKKEIINNCIKGIKIGDEDSLNTLYEIFSPRLYYVAIKYFKDVDVNDFVQDFWSDIQNICLKCVFVINGFGYLMKVAENRAKNKYKKDKKLYSIEVLDIERVKDYAYEGTCQENIEKNEFIEKCFRELDNVEKQIINAYYFENKTIREIAKGMGLPKSTVEYKRLKALEKMKNIHK